MARKYAYLKPKAGESPYYVHVTLDDCQHMVTVYYHRSWWKGETVDPLVFQEWREQLLQVKGKLKKSKMKKGPHALRVRGKGVIGSRMFKDIFGFVERDTHDRIKGKIEGYVHSKEKVIEMTITLPYKPLGSFPSEISKLPIFSSDPDAETVRTHLVFFNEKYVMNDKPSLATISDSQHDRKSSQATVGGGTKGVMSSEEKEEKNGQFQSDLRFASGSHPYGTDFSETKNTSSGSKTPRNLNSGADDDGSSPPITNSDDTHD